MTIAPVTAYPVSPSSASRPRIPNSTRSIGATLCRVDIDVNLWTGKTCFSNTGFSAVHDAHACVRAGALYCDGSFPCVWLLGGVESTYWESSQEQWKAGTIPRFAGDAICHTLMGFAARGEVQWAIELRGQDRVIFLGACCSLIHHCELEESWELNPENMNEWLDRMVGCDRLV
ncbi:predicted protein [Aspergillus nidulans FGSC A4]|uniref:Uncharacterized protein n=1 Tax=Emericella nidulans (strain FGSC A4 / ATCC 38163 / CBS 112.46 / NRRL 194 / M139) TaxID=227321 RepID=Q5B4Y8_EMENI|nr:hypothetical protein [Aspergillus nidulans FGSC A4]EAA60309.1 predicted protein [Aspergillus nidulans FGSC A4]CBF77620.1 TPA: conserved hypothetical protein [Aspergillus nidulans FGSC A4]|eukprot:XP_661996.1 predicted protein [Aspergillus nidulans FGSC A4]